jgi:hypothetical protein
MSLYRVRPGFTFGAFNQHGPGALVELSEFEAAGFLDKLEPADSAPHQLEPVAASPPAPSEPADALPPIWLDFGDLSKHLNMVRLLIANGYDTPAAVQMASDEELIAVKGIGPKALGALRAVLGSG